MELRKNRPAIVQSLLGKILKSKDFPAFAEHIAEVREVVEDDESSMKHITKVILKDVSLTMNVLRTANSAQYNRAGRGPVTVTHATSLLGLDAIRDLASGTMLFQHFWGKSANQKQLLLLSLLTASHARTTASRIAYPQIEEAYLCGMFRNLGEILVSGYMPRKYAVILQRMKEFGAGEGTACDRVLGCSYEDLGQAAAWHWKMPDRVRHCIQSRPSHVKAATISELDTARAVTSFSHGLTEAVHRGDPTTARDRLSYLLQMFGRALRLDRSAMQEIASSAIEETKSMFDLLHIPLDELKLHKQTEAAMAALDSVPEEGEEQQASKVLEPGEELLEQLTEEVELVLCSSTSYDLNRVLLMVLEAICRGAPFDRVVFGLVSQDHCSVHGRLGLGRDIDRFLAAFQFPLSIRAGPVGVALLGKQDSFIQDGRYAHTQFGQVVDCTNFGLMPLVIDDASVGIFYFDRQDDEPPNQAVRHQLARLRGLATEAFQVYRDSNGRAGRSS